MRRPIPNRLNEPETYGCSPVIDYTLTDVERAYLIGGELNQIPTAAERGLVASDRPRTVDIPKRQYSGKYRHITKELLKAELAAGKQVKDIAREQGVPAGMMDYLFKVNGVAR